MKNKTRITLRFTDPSLKAELVKIAAERERPLNYLINEAIKIYVEKAKK